MGTYNTHTYNTSTEFVRGKTPVLMDGAAEHGYIELVPLSLHYDQVPLPKYLPYVPCSIINKPYL